MSHNRDSLASGYSDGSDASKELEKDDLSSQTNLNVASRPSQPARAQLPQRNASTSTLRSNADNLASRLDLEKQQPNNEQGSGHATKDPNLIDWDGPDDAENPKNWPLSKKWAITVSMGTMTFVATFASSVFSTATVATSEQFGVSTEVMTLATSLFVLGYAWGPMS